MFDAVPNIFVFVVLQFVKKKTQSSQMVGKINLILIVELKIWFLSPSLAGHRDLRGAGAATLLASEEENLLGPKPRRIGPKELTHLTPEDPMQPLLKSATLPGSVALLGQRAPMQLDLQNSKDHPLPLPTSKAALQYRSHPTRLWASDDLTSLRLKDMVRHEAVRPTLLI